MVNCLKGRRLFGQDRCCTKFGFRKKYAAIFNMTNTSMHVAILTPQCQSLRRGRLELVAIQVEADNSGALFTVHRAAYLIFVSFLTLLDFKAILHS